MPGLASALKVLRRQGAITLLDRAWEKLWQWIASWRLSHLLGRARNLSRLPRLRRAHRAGKLNLGCGQARGPGFLNVDLGLIGELHVDAGRRFPFADNTFRLIFSEHMIEHLDEEQVARCLRECHRVLQPAGILRLCTPDLAYQIALYEDAGGLGEVSREQAAKVMPWKYAPGEAPTAAQYLNDAFYQWGHRHLYDREDLTRALTAAGFSHIMFYRPGEGSQKLTTGLESRIDGSLAVEAIKDNARNDERE